MGVCSWGVNLTLHMLYTVKHKNQLTNGLGTAANKGAIFILLMVG